MSLVIGFFLTRFKSDNKQISVRDGLSIVTLGWLIISLIGAIPLYYSNITKNFTDAFLRVYQDLRLLEHQYS